MGQAISVEAGHERKDPCQVDGLSSWKKLKLRKKQFAKALSVGKAKRSSQKSRDALQQADAANGKDAGICPLAAVNCHTDELTSSDNDIAPAGSISDNGSPTAQALLKGPASASDSKAAAFIHWAQSQSSSKQVSIDDFIVQQCQQDFVSQDALSMEGILAAAAAGGMLMPNISCSPADDSAQQLTVEPYLPHNGHVKGAPKPQCHADRIVAADGINALRATRDGEIEGMLRLLCEVFQVETATVALLTGEAIYITGACGALPVCVCPDRWGFCGWSFLNSHHELLVVEDMDADCRFSANFFVVEPQFHLKFYVAAPLVTSNGHRLGTLCIMGQEAQKFDALKAQMLANLAEMLVRQLEHRWVMALQESGNTAGLLRDLSCYNSCYFVLDLSSSPWRIVHMNEPARTATGVDWGAHYDDLPNYAEGRRTRAPFEGMPLNTLFDLSAATLTWGSSVHGSSGSSSSWEFKLTGLKPTADAPAALLQGLGAAEGAEGAASYSLTCKLAISDGLDESQPFYIGVPSWLALSEENTWGRNYFFGKLEVEGQLQQQQKKASPDGVKQQPLQGDSVEEIMSLTVGMLKQHVDAGGSSSGSSSAAPSSVSSSRRSSMESVGSGAPCWLPRGVSSSSYSSSSSGSNAGSVAGGTPTAAAGKVGASPFDSASDNAHVTPASAKRSSGSRTSSVRSFQTTASAGTLAPVVCRGMPIPGLLMGPLVGRGSYGKVYRGLWRGRPVAAKIIDEIASLKLTKSGEPLEISLTKDLKHTGIMSTLTYTYSDASAVPTSTTAKTGSMAGGVCRQRAVDNRPGRRVCWMLFEYCDKGVLADAVIRGWFRTTPHPLKGAPHLRVIGLTALEIAVAMKHLHEQGVLHGDLCGGNVMLTKSSSNEHGFTAKVGDFGLARINASGSGSAAHPVEQRLADNAYGTITHQPPEVLLDGGAAFTPAADVYAWGVLLWEMLTGSRAWAGMAAPAVVCQVAVLKRSLAIPKHLPKVLEDLLSRALSPKPRERPEFADIVEVLTEFVQESRVVDWAEWQEAVDAAHRAESTVIIEFDAAVDEAACGKEA